MSTTFGGGEGREQDLWASDVGGGSHHHLGPQATPGRPSPGADEPVAQGVSDPLESEAQSAFVI